MIEELKNAEHCDLEDIVFGVELTYSENAQTLHTKVYCHIILWLYSTNKHL